MKAGLFSARINCFVVALALGVASSPSALACATCYGASDSPLAAGMNWGIMTMIVVAYSVLFSIIGFFIFVARRAAAVAALEAEQEAQLDANSQEFHHHELCSKNS